uniref:Uncharacterized protein n=1 Tax=Timema shepardi TaxID=629360 RepID=A0A7R9B3V9_TIMSH|nr:unnamed protein product [Timema shepardi]
MTCHDCIPPIVSCQASDTAQSAVQYFEQQTSCVSADWREGGPTLGESTTILRQPTGSKIFSEGPMHGRGKRIDPSWSFMVAEFPRPCGFLYNSDDATIQQQASRVCPLQPHRMIVAKVKKVMRPDYTSTVYKVKVKKELKAPDLRAPLSERPALTEGVNSSRRWKLAKTEKGGFPISQ